jgi:hypothetical protein
MGGSDDDISIKNNSSAIMSPARSGVTPALYGNLEWKRIGHDDCPSYDFLLWNPLIASSIIHNERGAPVR